MRGRMWVLIVSILFLFSGISTFATDSFDFEITYVNNQKLPYSLLYNFENKIGGKLEYEVEVYHVRSGEQVYFDTSICDRNPCEGKITFGRVLFGEYELYVNVFHDGELERVKKTFSLESKENDFEVKFPKQILYDGYGSLKIKPEIITKSSSETDFAVTIFPRSEPDLSEDFTFHCENRCRPEFELTKQVMFTEYAVKIYSNSQTEKASFEVVYDGEGQEMGDGGSENRDKEKRKKREYEVLEEKKISNSYAGSKVDEFELVKKIEVTDSMDSTDSTDSENVSDSIVYELKLSGIGKLEKIEFENLVLEDETNLELGLDEFEYEFGFGFGNSSQAFAIDPSRLNFTTARVRLTATGNSLYKCALWNFSKRSCDGDWSLVRNDLVSGEEYEFEITPKDPGFVEIISADKVDLLDSNKMFVSDVFSKVQAIDNVSVLVPEDYFLRVNFEKDLVNGNDITLYANGTNSVVEVYEVNSDVVLERFENISDYGEYKIIFDSLPYGIKTFDLKFLDSVSVDFIIDPLNVSNVSLSSITPANWTTDDLILDYTLTDADGEFVQWYKNGNPVTIWDLPFLFNNSGGVGVTKDYSTANRDATVNGAVWNSANDGYYSFDGNDYLTTSYNQPQASNEEFSIAAWIRVSNSSQTGSRAIASWGANTFSKHMYFGLGSGETGDYPGRLHFGNLKDGEFAVRGSTDLRDGNWHLVVASKEASATNTSEVKLYVDGNLEVVHAAEYGSLSDLDSSDNPIRVGVKHFAAWNGDWGYFDGDIGGVWMFSEAIAQKFAVDWYNGDVHVLSGKQTRATETWSARVAAYNSTNVSDWVWSNGVTLIDVAEGENEPETTYLSINSTSGLNFTNDNLSCFARGIDDVMTNLTVYWRWLKNGIEQPALGGFANITANSVTMINVLNSTYTSSGDVWTCSVKMNDKRQNETNWNDISMTIISGLAPVVENVTLNSTTSFNYTNETLTVSGEGYDLDGDNVTLHYEWYRNGALFTTGASSDDSVLYFPADDTSGGFTEDESTENNDGSLVGVTWSSSSGVDGGAGFYFDGNDYISANSVTSDIAGKDSVIVGWFKTSSISGSQTLLALNTNGGGNRIILGHASGSDTIRVYDGSWHNSGVSFVDGAWHQIGFAFEDSTNTIRVIFDGQYVYNFSSSVSVQNDDWFSVGQDWDGGSTSEHYVGYGDEISILNDSLNSVELWDFYQNGFGIVHTNSTVPPEYTEVGDVWYALVTPNDGSQNGTSVQSNNIVIMDVPEGELSPVVQSVLINASDYPFNTTDADLSCYANITDDRVSNVTVYYKWFRDGVEEPSLAGSINNVAVNLSSFISMIDSSNTNRSEEWKCEVLPYDGYSNGTALNGSILILGAPPELENISLNATSSLNLTTDNLTLWFDTYDLDGDNVSVLIEWYRNGALFKTGGPIVELEFEGESNSTFTPDTSGFGNDGTVYFAQHHSTGSYDNSGYYEFDGISDWIDVGPVGVSGREERTIAAWVKADSLSQNDWTGIFGFSPSISSSGLFFDFQVDNGDNYCLHFYGEQYDFMSLDLNWHHLAATYDGNDARMYLDGTLIRTINVDLDTIDDVRLGKRGDNNNYFYGDIDEALVYNIALNDSEIKHLYDKGYGFREIVEIDSEDTLAGDNWTTRLRPFDGIQWGVWNQSNNITINEEVIIDLISPVNNSVADSNIVGFEVNITNYDDTVSWCRNIFNGTFNGTKIFYPYDSTVKINKYVDILPDGNWTFEVVCSRFGVDYSSGAYNIEVSGTEPFLNASSPENYTEDNLNLSYSIYNDVGVKPYLGWTRNDIHYDSYMKWLNQSDLRLWLTFDNLSNDFIEDKSIYEEFTVESGTISWFNDTLRNGVYYSDGSSNDAILVPAYYQEQDRWEPLTISAWARTTDNGWNMITSWGNDNDWGRMAFWIDDVLRGGDRNDYVYHDMNVTDNLWHHLVFRKTASCGNMDCLELYVDGIERSRTFDNEGLGNINNMDYPFTIGKDAENDWNRFNGYLDNIQVIHDDNIDVVYDLNSNHILEIYSRETLSGDSWSTCFFPYFNYDGFVTNYCSNEVNISLDLEFDLITPLNNTVSNDSLVAFEFNMTKGYDRTVDECLLVVDGVETNSSISNPGQHEILFGDLSNGVHIWNIRCKRLGFDIDSDWRNITVNEAPPIKLNATSSANLTIDDLNVWHNIFGANKSQIPTDLFKEERQFTSVVNGIDDKNLVLNLPFENYSSSSDVLRDFSFYDRNVTNKNAVWSYDVGFKGNSSSFYFDGDFDSINAGDIDELDKATKFTVAFWFNRDFDRNDGSYHGVENVMVSQSGDFFDDNLEIGSDGFDLEIYLDTIGGENTISFPAAVVDDTWYSLVVTYDSSWTNELKVYKDGVLIYETGIFGGELDDSTGGPFVLGGANMDHYGNAEFRGYLDEVQVYNVSFTQANVDAYHGQFQRHIPYYMTDAGDVWRAESFLTGTNYVSNNLTIVDISQGGESPVIDGVVLNATDSPQNLTTADLNCYVRAIDDLNSSFNVNYSWYKDGVLQGGFSGVSVVSNNTLSLVSTLGSASTSVGDNWTCAVTVFDGNSYSMKNGEIWWENRSILVINEPPEIVSLELNSSNIYNYSINNLTLNYVINEPNGDDYNISVRWFRDNYEQYPWRPWDFGDMKDDNLLLDMKFENSSTHECNGCVVEDWSIYNNDGTLVRGPDWTSQVPFKYADFTTGSYYFRRESRQQVRVPSSASLNSADEAVTISAWVYPTANSWYPGIFSRDDNRLTLRLYRDERRIQFRACYTNGLWTTTDNLASEIVPLNSWSHIVATYNESTARQKIYLNGILVEEDSVTCNLDHMGRWTQIGVKDDGYTENLDDYFEGMITDVQFYNVELNGSQVQNLYVRDSYNRTKVHEKYIEPGDIWGAMMRACDEYSCSDWVWANNVSMNISPRPNVTVYSPLNQTNIFGTFDVNFTFMPFDNETSNLSYRVYLNGILNESGTALSGNNVSFMRYNLSHGGYEWIISVKDQDNDWTNYTYVFNVIRQYHASLSKIFSHPEADRFGINLTLVNYLNVESNISVIDFVDSSFNYVAFTPIPDWSDPAAGTWIGSTFGWNFVIPSNSVQPINYTIRRFGNDPVSNNFIFGLD